MMGFKLKLSKQSSFFYIFIGICVLLTMLCLVFRCGFTAKVHDTDLYFQIHKTLGQQNIVLSPTTNTVVVRRRLLGGPGSSPPRCAWKCDRCTPCRPVHVAVPPGTPVTAEYYPEAWRCKCGNRLYMP